MSLSKDGTALSTQVLAVLRGGRNGVIYGGRVRFAHSLVMTLLFRRGSWGDKFTSILKMTQAHATNLGLFAIVYKGVNLLLSKLSTSGWKPWHAFVAGWLGGFYIWGDNTALNQQVVLYMFSRAITGLAKHWTKGSPSVNKDNNSSVIFAVFAAFCWAVGMYLFETDSDSLQQSLVTTQNYIFRDSNVWQGWADYVFGKYASALPGRSHSTGAAASHIVH